MTDAPERIWIDVEHLDSQSKVLACNLGTAHKERALGTDVEYVRADLADRKHIETAHVSDGWFRTDDPDNPPPKDELHTRGLWVYSARPRKRIRWEAITGYINDDGDFVDHEENAPWHAEDYTHWHPLPAPPEDD